MQEFIDQAPDDDLVDAIAENNTILTRKEAELVKLKEFYAQITGVKLTPAQTQPPAAQTEVKTPATSAATEVNTNDDVGMFL